MNVLSNLTMVTMFTSVPTSHPAWKLFEELFFNFSWSVFLLAALLRGCWAAYSSYKSHKYPKGHPWWRRWGRCNGIGKSTNDGRLVEMPLVWKWRALTFSTSLWCPLLLHITDKTRVLLRSNFLFSVISSWTRPAAAAVIQIVFPFTMISDNGVFNQKLDK